MLIESCMKEKKAKKPFFGSKINLNSSEWCDIIFEGRNKRYGAYKMRQTSAKRHLVAFLVVFVVFTFFALLPSLIKTIIYNKYHDEMTEVTMLSDIKLEEDVDVIPLEETPPPPLVPSITTPKIPDEKKISSEIEIVDDPNLKEEIFVQPSESEQKDTVVAEEKEETVDENSESYKIDEIYTFVEEMPAFRGGEPGLIDFLSKNLRYPYNAQNSKMQGSVICTFIIEKDGSVSHVKITQEANPLFNKEALRVLMTMPKWKPGKKHGMPVKVKYTLPIIFSLH